MISTSSTHTKSSGIIPDASSAPRNLVAMAFGLVFSGLLLVGCSSSATFQSPPPDTDTSTLSYSPNPAEANQLLTISGSVMNLNDDNPVASWNAVRDGAITVASGTVNSLPGGGAVPLSFTDAIPTPGVHSYNLTITSTVTGISQTMLTVPVVYVLSPGIQATMLSASAETLTLTLTNNGSGILTFSVPYTVTDTHGMTSGGLQTFNLSATPLSPGASISQTLVVGLPLSGNDTFTFTIDPLGTLGTNLVGSPAMVSIPFGSG